MRKPLFYPAPGDMSNLTTQELNAMRSFPALVNFVYHLNSTREPHEPLVRLRKAQVWEKVREKALFVVCLYDLAKDLEQEPIKCNNITVVRGYLLGIVSLRRFRRNLKTSA